MAKSKSKTKSKSKVITNFPIPKEPYSMKHFDHFDANFKKLVAQDEKAKDEDKLVGRYIQEQIADGYAYYVIVRENKRTVRIRHATGLGDDWMIPYWGEEASIDKSYALQRIDWRDGLDALFSKAKS
jgi:hypothetical protein